MKNVFIQKTKIFTLTVIKCLSVGDAILRASGILTHLILVTEVQECWKRHGYRLQAGPLTPGVWSQSAALDSPLRLSTLSWFCGIQKWEKPGPWHTALLLVPQQPNPAPYVERSNIFGNTLTFPFYVPPRAYLIQNLPAPLSMAHNGTLIIRFLNWNPGFIHWRIRAKAYKARKTLVH